jgi:curved DNA-binding protein CbpA
VKKLPDDRKIFGQVSLKNSKYSILRDLKLVFSQSDVIGNLNKTTQQTLKDYYKILNVTFGASEAEIKKRFRKLATIHHPDKNGGSKKSEETFKEILNAYETLSNKKNREIYDLKYRQHFQQSKTETPSQNRTNTNAKQEEPRQSPPRNREYQNHEKSKPNANYSFWIIVVLLALLYFFYNANKTTTGNTKADKQLEEQGPENRPQSGELDFNK